MREITVEQLYEWRRSGRDFVLLDVREEHEVAQAALPGAQCIALRDVLGRLHELSRESEIAVICHHGVRSAMVVSFLEARGFRAYNVEGGIDAYAARVDPSIPRYHF